MITKNDGYGYIEEFIQYLRELIEIMVNLFKGLQGEETTTTAPVTTTTPAA